MRIGAVKGGFKLTAIATVAVEPPSYFRGRLVDPTFSKGEDGKPLFTGSRALPPSSGIYVTPAGVAKLNPGVLISER